ncbi:unnamed protein product [Rotaria sp. Silwood1]|nr:unnamed protein product [Rotaria sp. Silwood1]CAF3578552.1 unnamed protein product [Rotaria sp. Silwood1]CAF3662974.1 unnamed protein product [Rotaria sp. Silwood1]CAF4788669.1 unnamed protein product [Rotaria sp. Silwood1]CAF4869552.1 unnamed protein product [Rotaria sp. Silwood1]
MPGTRLQVGKIEPHEKDKGITLVYLQEQSVTGKEAPMPILMRSESQYEQTPSGKNGTLAKTNAINGIGTSNIVLGLKPKEVYFDA